MPRRSSGAFPTIEFFHRTAPIGHSPFYLSLVSSLSFLYVNRGFELARGSYGRFDVHPILSFPWKEIPGSRRRSAPAAVLPTTQSRLISSRRS
jgi:hypothetical protein